MDGELLIIIVAGILSTSVAAIAKINGDRKQKKYEIMQDSLIASQDDLTDTQTKLLGLYESNKKQTDTIVNLQIKNQEITNNIVILQNELQEKTKEVAELSRNIIESQNELLAESDRQKNPLFPMMVEIDISVPFSSSELGEIFITSLYQLKSDIENNELKNKENIIIIYDNDNKIKFLKIVNNPEVIRKIKPINIFRDKRVDIILQKESKYKNDGLSDPIFMVIATLNSMYSLGGGGFLEINYEKKQILFSCNYNDVTIYEPRNITSIGIIDLHNNYLIVEPKEVNDYMITKFTLSGKTEYSRYQVNINFSEEERKKLNNRTYFLHKIDKKEIQQYRSYPLQKLH